MKSNLRFPLAWFGPQCLNFVRLCSLLNKVISVAPKYKLTKFRPFFSENLKYLQQSKPSNCFFAHEKT